MTRLLLLLVLMAALASKIEDYECPSVCSKGCQLGWAAPEDSKLPNGKKAYLAAAYCL